MFVRTEHQVAYATMFTTVRTYASAFCEIDLVLAFGSLDHSQYIANDYMQYLSKTRSQRQFTALGKHFLSYWRSQEKAEYAQWFEDTYLASPWASWYYQGATPGVTPSQNALSLITRLSRRRASHHFGRALHFVKNSTTSVKVQLLFVSQSQLLCIHLTYLCTGPLCSGAVGRAKPLLDNKKNYYALKVPKPRAVFGVLFDGTKFLISCRNINGSAPTRGRAQPLTILIACCVPSRYLKSLGGPTLQYSSLLSFDPPIKFLHVNCLAKFTPSAGYPYPVDSRKYVCDCVFFVKTGWQSSYVLAAMVLQDEVNVSGLLKSLPTRKASGGQRKAKSCHTKDRSDHSQFSVAGLVKLYLATPVAPIHWNVMRGFEVNKEGVLTNESFLGTVISWGNNDGVYCWTVTFTKAKKTVMLECQN
ncbi:hypothetical protein GQ600_9636 [Phytophthora cactorum]|nr:hypothetical protein GQ600_9636 [Phytophthora cactorum]